MISSAMPSPIRSGAVSFRCSAACSAMPRSFHRMAAQPSGEITQYHEFSSMRMQSPTPTPSAPPLAPSPMTMQMTGVFEREHLADVLRDGLGLAALLGADAGVRAGRVDEHDDRQLELLGHAHDAHRLAVAFGVAHAPVALQVLLRVSALLLADHRTRAGRGRSRSRTITAWSSAK